MRSASQGYLVLADALGAAEAAVAGDAAGAAEPDAAAADAAGAALAGADALAGAPPMEEWNRNRLSRICTMTAGFHLTSASNLVG